MEQEREAGKEERRTRDDDAVHFCKVFQGWYL